MPISAQEPAETGKTGKAEILYDCGIQEENIINTNQTFANSFIGEEVTDMIQNVEIDAACDNTFLKHHLAKVEKLKVRGALEAIDDQEDNEEASECEIGEEEAEDVLPLEPNPKIAGNKSYLFSETTVKRKKIYCYICSNQIKPDDGQAMKCQSCYEGFHKSCLDRENLNTELNSKGKWWCPDCKSP